MCVMRKVIRFEHSMIEPMFIGEKPYMILTEIHNGHPVEVFKISMRFYLNIRNYKRYKYYKPFFN